MFYFTPETIANANKNIQALDAKAGGLLCVLYCLTEDIEENISYTIDGEKLRKQLSLTFDKEPKDSFENVKPSYIIFAKDWANTFFEKFIKKRIDLLSCAVFFLRRHKFDRELSKEEVIDTFVKYFNLKNYKDLWFSDSSNFTIAYNQANVEDNQIEFYFKMEYTNEFKSILFNSVIQKSAADLKAAGQIQTLYSGSGVQSCFLISDAPLDQYYVMSNSSEAHSNSLNNKDSAINKAENIILYGVPGCGKSFTIKRDYCDDDKLMERVVFHPDYTYSDFVGQILPKTTEDENGNKHIEYPFSPGPFTRILRKAVNDDEHRNYYLIVEEINRGNAPAIFGEVFQLLDRKNGESEYGINNPDIAREVYHDASHSVKIPDNLFIIGTMNTADQNVFTLDTAFKRRWKMVSIPNNIKDCEHANDHICGRNVTWYAFASQINDKIIEYGKDNLSSEDNRLGAYFIKSDELDDAAVFSEKVLMYLWNDAFKYDHDKVFDSQYDTLEKLIDGFKDVKFDVFNKETFTFDNEPYEVETEVVLEDTTATYLADKISSCVDLYRLLLQKIKESIPNVEDHPTQKGHYVVWSVPGIKRSFADVIVNNKGIILNVDQPYTDSFLSILSKESPNSHKKHKYSFKVTSDDNIEEAVQIVLESYKRIKNEG